MKIVERKWLLDSKGDVFNDQMSIPLRSTVGMVLHDRSCLNQGYSCRECFLSQNCSYSRYFESNCYRTETNHRDHLNHSYRIAVVGRKLKLVCFGDDCLEVSEVFSSLLDEAGQIGVGQKDRRVRFELKDLQEKQLEWRYGETSYPSDCREILVQFNTPVRFKTDDKLNMYPTTRDILFAMHRRMETLVGSRLSFQYEGIESNRRFLRWVEWDYYSSRQERGMKLGGNLGCLTLEGQFSPELLSLLELSSYVGVGKNSSFGLGDIDVWLR